MKKTKQRSATLADTELGRKIRLRRVELGISQSDLAGKLNVSFQQVQKYEKGVNRVGASRLVEIAKVLDVDITYFYGHSSKQQKEVDSLLFVDSSFGIRMIRAWSAIKNQAVQRNLVALMETMAAESA